MNHIDFKVQSGKKFDLERLKIAISLWNPYLATCSVFRGTWKTTGCQTAYSETRLCCPLKWQEVWF